MVCRAPNPTKSVSKYYLLTDLKLVTEVCIELLGQLKDYSVVIYLSKVKW